VTTQRRFVVWRWVSRTSKTGMPLDLDGTIVRFQ